MTILIDIGHPAHVHFYRHFIANTRDKHNILVIARDKEVTADLLDSLGIDYIDRGTGGGSSLSKCFYLVKVVLRLMKLVWQHDVDVLTGIGNPYVALAGFFTRRPSIVFNDTEHAATTVWILRMFASVILTPTSYFTSEGVRHLRYPGFHELAYLHPNNFTPDPRVLKELGVEKDEPFVVLRFVAWQATHDIGHPGLSQASKCQLVQSLSEYARVFVSSEGGLPAEFQQYRLTVAPEKMHDVLAFASLYVGEGATMASECVMLGTPAIYVNELTAGTIEEQEKYGLLLKMSDVDSIIEKAGEFLLTSDLRSNLSQRHKKMLAEKIDVTAFISWFIEHFPASVEITRRDPAFILQFSGTPATQNIENQSTPETV